MNNAENLLSPAEIHAAWLLAASHAGTATHQVLMARLALLDVGFGGDHPQCLALDTVARKLAELQVTLRAGAT